jgi:hypothetical protein
VLLTLTLPRIHDLMTAATIEAVYARAGDALAIGAKLCDLTVDLSAVAAQDCPPISHFRLVLRERLWVRDVGAAPSSDLAVGAHADAVHHDARRAARRRTRARGARVDRRDPRADRGVGAPARMSQATLKLGALGTTVAPVVRSGIRWIHDDGHACRAHDIVGWCNVRVGVPAQDGMFADEARDLQVAFATRVAGTLKRGAETSRGGFLDRLPELERWQAGQTIGHVELQPGQTANGDALRPMFVAGRRVVEVAEDRSGLLTGWHDRLRAWWGDGDAPPSTLMGLGICDQSTLFRGDAVPFHDWFAATRGPAHVVFVPDHVLAPCAAVITEQLRRTPDEAKAIRDDFTRTFAKLAPSPEDWMLAGSLVAAVLRSPLGERLDVLGPSGIVATRGVDALVLSVNAEQPRVWRHKTLGYAISVHGYRLKERDRRSRRGCCASSSRCGRASTTPAATTTR